MGQWECQAGFTRNSHQSNSEALTLVWNFLSAKRCSESFAKINSSILHDNTQERCCDYPDVTNEKLRPQAAELFKGVAGILTQ